jgi:hypothetical protein
MAAVQSEAEAPVKNAANPHFKSKFADLAHVLEVLSEPMKRNGIAVVQMPVTAEKSAGVHTRILHTSGQELDCGACVMPLERPGPQAVGSAITYARRYSLMAIFCLAAEDDDGETAEGRGKGAKSAPKRTLADVADDPLADVAACGITYDGKAPPVMPRGVPPVFPAGEHEGKSMDVVPVDYLRGIYSRMKTAEMKLWAEYLIKAHAFSKMNGGE